MSKYNTIINLLHGFPNSQGTFIELIGKTIKEINISESKDYIEFVLDNGEKYSMYHEQDCCESVYIEDIIGDLNDLIGSPIVIARGDSSGENPKGIKIEYQESFTWTFYNFATAKGYVTIRWYGASNGYYSESVQFINSNSVN